MSRSVKEMFDAISGDYDRTNAVLSLGLHHRWNRRLAAQMHGKLLDLCAGTGEIAFHYLARCPHEEAILLDFSPEMLAIADKKGRGNFHTLVGDAQAIPLEDASVDSVSMAYGIRNVPDRETCFSEIFRVLKPGGRLGILELTRPHNPLLSLGHKLYLKTLPMIGRSLTRDKEAYSYLSRTISTFISPQTLTGEMRQAGFLNPTHIPLLGGVSTLFCASKAP